MRPSRPFQIVRLICSALVVLAVSVALTGLSFAHRAPSTTDTMFAAYQLIVADTGDLCEGGASAKANGDCQACRLSGATLLPAPSVLVRSFACRAQRDPVMAEIAAPPARVRDPAHGLRAPPAPRLA